MSNSIEYTDFCDNCNEYLLCTKRTIITRPLLFCEEYEPKVNSKSNDHNSKLDTSYSDSTDENITQLKGICNNCANRETCKHPKPEEGIWRCEEYE